MRNDNRGTYRGPSAWCLACDHYDCQPRELAVDLDGLSKDEADALCALHRGRLTEGACVLCGRRLPWVMLHESSDVGACRPCFVSCFGEAAACDVEVAWRTLEWARSL